MSDVRRVIFRARVAQIRHKRQPEDQLPLFPEYRFSEPEVRRGELADRPRKRRRK